MNIHEDDNGFKWFDTLEDCKPEYYPIKVTTPLMFYTLKGRTSIITKANIEPLRYVHYVVYAKSENRYYYRFWKMATLDDFYGYQSDDQNVVDLRRYISDGNLYLLFTQSQINDNISMLQRAWKGYLTGDGQLDYKMFLRLVEAILRYEELRDTQKNITGYKTACSIQEKGITDLWLEASQKNRLKQEKET